MRRRQAGPSRTEGVRLSREEHSPKREPSSLASWLLRVLASCVAVLLLLLLALLRGTLPAGPPSSSVPLLETREGQGQPPAHSNDSPTLSSTEEGAAAVAASPREPAPLPPPPAAVPPAAPSRSPSPLPLSLLWMAPFLSGGGYCTEALAFLQALAAHRGARRLRSLHAAQHGDGTSSDFLSGLPQETVALLQRHLLPTRRLQGPAVVVCHSEPGAWDPPLFQTAPCPPRDGGGPRFIVGRTLFETDRVSAAHVERINRMDEVWVPTTFHAHTFVASGVQKHKLVVVPQAVDTHAFDPARHQPLPLPWGDRVFGGGEGSATATIPVGAFVFLSIFKWEARKGWEILLRAFLEEFSAADRVLLYVATAAYHSDAVFAAQARAAVERWGLQPPPAGWAPVHICHQHVPQSALPRLYRAAHAFVLPSRGEGWGRPLVEAMAMELPVIATNWSGMTEFMTPDNSYPLPIEGLVPVEEGAFVGHLWAQPSLAELRRLMRRVYEQRAEGEERGRQARKDMLRRFRPEVIADLVMAQLERIANVVSAA